MMSTPQSPQVRAIFVTVEGAEELPILFANAFFIQASGDGSFVLTVAQAAPPLFSGTPEEQQEKMMQVTSIAGRPLARLALSPAKLKELAEILRVTSDAFEAMTREGTDGASRAFETGQRPTDPGGTPNNRPF